MGETQSRTASDALVMLQEQMIKQNRQMREFRQSIYAHMAKGVKAQEHRSDETFRYYDEQWKHDSLVPDSAVELVDEMF
jgi:hypothetical protein